MDRDEFQGKLLFKFMSEISFNYYITNCCAYFNNDSKLGHYRGKLGCKTVFLGYNEFFS